MSIPKHTRSINTTQDNKRNYLHNLITVSQLSILCMLTFQEFFLLWISDSRQKLKPAQCEQERIPNSAQSSSGAGSSRRVATNFSRFARVPET